MVSATSFVSNSASGGGGLVTFGAATVVRQRMEYELKLGVVGKLMDRLVVRRKWDAGIKGFFAGLKRHVEDAAD